MNDNERPSERAMRLASEQIAANRATALASFMDEMTEQVEFARRKFGHQNIRECVATIRAYCDKLEDTIPPAGDETSIPNKTERLNAALAIAVLAFRAHYGD